MKNFPKTGLSLSGGGAKGIAHISVIRELEKLNVPIFCVSGTSMGALIGAWFAAGKDLDVLLDLFSGNKWRKYLHLTEMIRSVKRDGGLFSLQFFKDFLDKEFKGLEIENLEKKYVAIATSLRTGKKVELKSGKVSDAVLASICLPVVFSPIQVGDDFLVDGGLQENFPVDACFELGADVVIGSDVRYAPNYLHEEIKDGGSPLQWRIFKVLSYLMEMVNVQREKEESDKLVIIKPYVSHVSTFDFDRSKEILKLGTEAFVEKEEKIREMVGLPPKEKSFWDSLFEG